MFKWSTGAIISTIAHNGYSGLIQQLEGKWDLFVMLYCPDGSTILKNEITSWFDAQFWIESEIKSRLSGKQNEA